MSIAIPPPGDVFGRGEPRLLDTTREDVGCDLFSRRIVRRRGRLKPVGLDDGFDVGTQSGEKAFITCLLVMIQQ